MESNKLIAEFMGRIKTFDIVDNDTYRGEVTLSKGLVEEQIESEISHFEDRYSITSIAIEENLQYHTSWDWLMPVVEKCLEKHNNLIDGRDVIDTLYPTIAQALQVVSRKETYKAVVEFIKQYNK